MDTFLNGDFLLTTKTGKRLYHSYGSQLPIIDYHCHISPKEIYENRKFENMTQIWLGADHYKWRLMRANGIEEDYITGNTTDWDKFQAWAETMELAIGNPLYTWSHLELKRYFDYSGHLNRESAKEVWDLCNKKLQEENMSARELIRRSNVSVLCTTDDPVDSLEWHKKLEQDATFQTVVLPSFRADRAMQLEKEDYTAYIKSLEVQSGVVILSFRDLMNAIKVRMDHFELHGCKLADTGLSEAVYHVATMETIEDIFLRRMTGEVTTKEEQNMFQTMFLLEECKECHRRGWVMQIHYGCSRNNNRSAFETLGVDTGYDAINRDTKTNLLMRLLDKLEQTEQLPKMILYSLDPFDDVAIDTLIGCFQRPGAAGWLQHGSAWWFNDNKSGITRQLTSLAEQGLLGNFVGMLTDSRSFLSYTRHEYFRRILCDLIGRYVEQGEYPADEKALKRIIDGICYQNAKAYFSFPIKETEREDNN